MSWPSVCLSVSLSACLCEAATGRIFLKFDPGDVYEILSKIYLFKIGLKLLGLYMKTRVSCWWQRYVQSNNTETVLLRFHNKSLQHLFRCWQWLNGSAIHSECTVAFPWQQYLHWSTTILSCTHLTCLATFNIFRARHDRLILESLILNLMIIQWSCCGLHSTPPNIINLKPILILF